MVFSTGHSTVKFTGLNPVKIQEAANTEQLAALIYTKAVQIKAGAIAILVSRTKHTHMVTPPPAIGQFKIRRTRRNLLVAWEVYNDDPAYFWIEFGAYLHDVNHPRILRYAPLRLALDAVNRVN